MNCKLFIQKSTIFILTLLFILPSMVFADFDIKEWKYEKDIKGTEYTIHKDYVEMVFDEEVFENANKSLSDIRIIANDTEEVPYKLLVEKELYTSESHAVNLINNSFVPGQYSYFIADLGRDDILHNQIEILVSPQSINFRREVTVEGSNDQQNWHVLTDKGHIYDYTVEFKKQYTRVTYPESAYRYLQVKVMNNDLEPLDIIGATVYRVVKTPAREVSYKAEIIERGEDTEKSVNFIVMDIGSKGLPSNKLSVKTSDINFNREIALEGSNDKENWGIIEYRDVIYSYATPKFTGAKLDIGYPESTYRYFKLTIFNKDNPPIMITGASVFGLLRKLLFEYDPLKTYKLYYGNHLARYPEYDLEKYFPYLDIQAPLQVSLGSAKVNPLFEEALQPPKPFTERYPWLLPVVLAIVVLILGGLIVRLILSARKEAK